MRHQPRLAGHPARFPHVHRTGARNSLLRGIISPFALAIIAPLFVFPVARADQARAVVAAGPAFLHSPGDLSEIRPWVPGIALDVFAAVPGSVAKKRAPRRFRGAISSKGEVRVAPLWLSIIPKEIYTGPDDSLAVWGARWEMLGIGTGVSLGGGVSLHAGIDAPAIAVLHFDGPAIHEETTVWNLGLDGAVGLSWRPADWIEFESGWTHQLGVATGRIAPRSGNRSLPWQFGVARLLVHGRIPFRVRK